MTTRQRQLQEAYRQAMTLAGANYEQPLAHGHFEDESFLDGDDIIRPDAEELVGLSPQMQEISLDVARELFDEFASEADQDEVLVTESPAWRNERRIERLREAA